MPKRQSQTSSSWPDEVTSWLLSNWLSATSPQAPLLISTMKGPKWHVAYHRVLCPHRAMDSSDTLGETKTQGPGGIGAIPKIQKWVFQAKILSGKANKGGLTGYKLADEFLTYLEWMDDSSKTKDRGMLTLGPNTGVTECLNPQGMNCVSVATLMKSLACLPVSFICPQLYL